MSFNDKKREGEVKFIQSGFWHWSRHPNYCAEIFIWLGIWLSSSSGLYNVNTAYAVVGVLSPLITFVLVTFITGIPLTEKRDDARFKQLDDYYDYKKRTSPLWFFPTTLYRKMPMWLRRFPFFDIFHDYKKLRQEPGADQSAADTAQEDGQQQQQLEANSSTALDNGK